MKRHISILSTAALLSACAGPPDGKFPSLAKRPYEGQQAATGAEIANPQAAALPGTVAAEISALEARVDAADAAFNGALPAARARFNAARGAARNSEAWLSAHTQLSRLDRTRSDGLQAAAQMDRLVSKRLEAELAGEMPFYSKLMAARQTVVARKIQAQNEIIDSFSRGIGF